MGRREQLLAEQERIKNELANLEEIESGIIKLEDYTDEQKINFFDSLYKMASDVIKETEENGYYNEDNEYWFYEMGMSVLNLNDNDKLWKYIRSLT